MDWTYNTIWTELLPEGMYQHVLFDKKVSNWVVPSNALYYIIEDFKPKNNKINELSGIVSPKFLQLNRSNIHSFSGINEFGSIKRLELFHCIKLESDEGLSAIKDDIEWLHIDTSRKFSPGKELYSLSKLKVLCLNDCGPIESLEFLSNFPDLVDFRFVNTNIVNGDLNPLLEHPSLLNVGFLNKRHYNLKSDEADKYFEEKAKTAKEFAHKGEYVTYRYKAFRN